MEPLSKCLRVSLPGAAGAPDTFSGTLLPGATRACLTASPRLSDTPSCFGVTVSVTLPRRSTSGRAEEAFTAAVASAGDETPTRTSPPTVTQRSDQSDGRGVVGGRDGSRSVVVVVGGAIVVPVVVPVSASTNSDAARTTREHFQPAAHATSRVNASPRLTSAV